MEAIVYREGLLIDCLISWIVFITLQLLSSHFRDLVTCMLRQHVAHTWHQLFFTILHTATLWQTGISISLPCICPYSNRK